MNQIGFFLNASRETTDEDMISISRRADSLDYHSFWTGEPWGRDAFTVLTMVACHTKNLRLGTGIITQTIAPLDILSKGRAILGLGSSGRAVVENWHGVPLDAPLARTREYINIVRKALAGGPVSHQGRFYKMDRFRMMSPHVQERILIYVASLGPKNLALTGELADGWLPIWVSRGRLPELKEHIGLAAAKPGRETADVIVAPYIMSNATSCPQDLTHGDQLLRAHMAYYIGGMGNFYFDSFSRTSFAVEAQAVQEAWSSGERERAAATVSARMLESVAVLGTPQQCRSQMAQFRRSGCDIPIATFPHGADTAAAYRTIEALAPQARNP